MRIEIYDVGEKVRHAEHGIGEVKGYLLFNDKEASADVHRYSVFFESGVQHKLEFFELTPIEPEPALDAKARELIAKWQMKDWEKVHVSPLTGYCNPADSTPCQYCADIDSPEALAAVRAHLAAQEKK